MRRVEELFESKLSRALEGRDRVPKIRKLRRLVMNMAPKRMDATICKVPKSLAITF